MIGGIRAEAETFYLHEDVVTQHSEFFAAALKKGWTKSTSRSLCLEDDNPACFDLFASFIYNGRIHSHRENDTATAGQDEEWSRLAACWILGDKLISTTFKDAIMDEMRHKLRPKQAHPTGLHGVAYPQTSGPNAFRRFTVDISVWLWSAATMENQPMDESLNEFFRDVAVRVKVVGPTKSEDALFLKDDCCYHEHIIAGTPCYKVLFRQRKALDTAAH